MPNRLSTATSPYLLQHQNNPVDWFPWGEEAIEKARREDKPIFLSIGYSACHWCHVMEHESFESAHIAAILNEFFVSIKVDREERPDLDHIYMQAVQMLTGSGGWPMSVFLTGELRPFYGGTYWPPVNRYGRPGFDQVLHAVANAWRDKREQIVEQSIEMTKQLELSFQTEASSEDSEDAASLTHALLIQADCWLQKHFDSTYGGFGGAPKFPHAMDLALLLQLDHRQPNEHRLRVVTHTLDKMAQGGIYDHLAGGFARYSVDERWLVPHFEKMLYDNGLLIPLYADAYLVTGKALYREVVEQSLGYILREMTSPEGAFYSTEDADSEGEEGKFYVWSREEIIALLGEKRGETFCDLYDVTKAGNFEGHNILNLPKSIETFAAMRKLDLATFQQQVSEDRETLRLARAKRIRPGLDDKILVSWNALMIDALARCSRSLGSKVYLEAAQKAAQFIQNNMLKSDGRLLHTHRLGESRYDAYLDDYTYLANALISLYECDFDERWLQWAEELLGLVEKHFADPRGGYFFTADDHEALIARVKDSHDSSVPSGNAMAATAMIRLGRLTGESRWIDAAEKNLKSLASLMARAPQAAGQALLALDLWLGPAYQLACVGSRDSELAREFLANARKKFRPQLQIAWRDEASDHRAACMDAYWTGKEKGTGELAVYLCYHQTCQAPVSDRDSLERLLNTIN